MAKNEHQTRYPFSRQQVIQMFKKRISFQTEKLYDIDAAHDIILDNVDQMEKWNYFIKYQLNENSSFKHKHMRRKVKAKFRCKYCNKSFTSILGTFQINFNITIRWLRIRQQAILDQDMKLYDMKCQNCKRLCSGQIYQSQLQAVAKSFCIVLAQIIDDVPPPQHKDDRFKLNQNVHHHKEELCEACRKGVCFNFSKGQIYKKQNNQATSRRETRCQYSSEDEEKLQFSSRQRKISQQKQRMIKNSIQKQREKERQAINLMKTRIKSIYNEGISSYSQKKYSSALNKFTQSIQLLKNFLTKGTEKQNEYARKLLLNCYSKSSNIFEIQGFYLRSLFMCDQALQIYQVIWN